MVRPVDIHSRPQRSSLPHINTRNYTEHNKLHWVDGDISNSNGVFITPHIKMEKIDDDQLHDGGQESPYHTPLLNFDQVEFHSSGKESCDIPNSSLPDMTPTEPIDDEVDRIGREQLLFPEPVEGVSDIFSHSSLM